MRRVLCVLLFAALGAASRTPARAQTQATDPELNKGIQLVDEGDFDAGVKTLGAVVKRLQATGGSARDLSRAHLYLGIAHVGLRNESSAKSSFLEALRADPGLTLSADEFPPRVVAAFQLAKREAPAGPSPRPSIPATSPSVSPPPRKPDLPKTSPVVFIEAVKQGDFSTVRTLLNEDPGLINEKDDRFGATSLHWAALRGHTAIAALLLERGANASLTNGDGETPLVVAQRAKRTDIEELLKKAGAPAAGGGSGSIFDAAKVGDAPAVRRMLDENSALVNRQDTGFGATPLHWAALRGHAEVARVLIERGADPNLRNNEGETPLQVAERSKRTEIVQLLRARGVQASASLTDAVRDGDLPKVQQLLSATPGLLNQKDAAFGATPLHWAALRGHAEIVRYLLAQGADASVRNKEGETPLQVAQRGRRSDVIALLQGGAAPPAAPKATPPAATVTPSAPAARPPASGSGPASGTSLVDAVKAGDLARVRALLAENPGQINAKDPQFGATLLHWAALRGHAPVAEYLVAQGADVNAKNGAGETPLQVAQRAGRAEVVRILSKSGS